MTTQPHDLVFAPLGGVGEIGMNLSLYGFGPARQRQWMAVDFGLSFAGEAVPGVDVVFPDIRYLVKERKNLLGIVITHGHEDHIGALIDLWPKLRVPVYATPFTAALIEAKRRGEPGAPEIPIQVMPLGSRFDLGPFDIEFIAVAHSIPESNALAIRTPVGTILHTGDWKIDSNPYIGAPTDEAKLRALGEEGVLALIGDSTNAVRDGRSPSETDVAHSLKEIIAGAKGRVAVTTFASNVSRLKAVADAARACGREVVLVGRAMERIVQVARETGYLKGVQEFRGVDTYGYLPPDKVLALCTGSQGEPRAALSRIAQDDHPEVTLSRGDCVIFSSRAIPGNEKAVGDVINGLILQGVEVVTDRTHLVHVSGHPRREELRDMISWVHPQMLMPVHGEALHLSAHAVVAREAGVKTILRCRDGEVVRLGPGAPGVVEEVPVGRLYKDGRLLVPALSRTIKERKRLAFAGIVTVALAMNGKGELAGNAEVEIAGLPENNAAGEDMTDIVYETVMTVFESLPRARRRDPDAVAESISRAVRSKLAHDWGKKPVCHVHVLSV